MEAVLPQQHSYAAGALFTLALNDVISSSVGSSTGADEAVMWGLPEGEAQTFIDDVGLSSPEKQKQIDAHGPAELQCLDCVAAGGICELVFKNLHLPDAMWQGLKVLPLAAGGSASDDTNHVDSLLAILKEGNEGMDHCGDVPSHAFLPVLFQACLKASTEPDLQTEQEEEKTTTGITQRLGKLLSRDGPTSKESGDALPATQNERESMAEDGVLIEGPALTWPRVCWYDARCRQALRKVVRWLGRPWEDGVRTEARLAGQALSAGLSQKGAEGGGGEQEQAAAAPSAPPRSASRLPRTLAIGAAAAGGGLLLAVTGGLAAPAVAAGLGTVISSTGAAVGVAGSSAAFAGLLTGVVGSTAGTLAIVGSLGYAGSTITGKKLARRLGDVKEFAFVLVLEEDRPAGTPETLPMEPPSAEHVEIEGPQVDTGDAGAAAERLSLSPEVAKAQALQSRLLPVPLCAQGHSGSAACLGTCIAISGWVTSRDQFTAPWAGPRGRDGRAVYAAVWEPAELLKLGTMLYDFATSQAKTYAVKWFTAQFISAALVAAVALPLTIVSALGLLDSQWGVVMNRARKCGALLAYLLMSGAHGDRPIKLIGYSMGARIIYYCLQELAAKGARGIVEEAVFIGAPVGVNTDEWATLRGMVAGRIVNCYSAGDWILGVMYRSGSGFLRQSAGLVPVQVRGIDNVDVSNLVDGHLDYVIKIPAILDHIESNAHIFLSGAKEETVTSWNSKSIPTGVHM